MTINGWTSNLSIVVFVITVGSGFHHGFHTGIITIPQKAFEAWIKKVDTERNSTPSNNADSAMKFAVIVAAFPVGGMLGSILGSLVVDSCGRKRALLWNNFLVVVGASLMSLSGIAKSYEILMIGRVVVGVNAGLSCGIAPIYLTEIAPTRIRGAVGSCYQLMLTIGVVVAQVTAMVLGTEAHWPFMFIVPLVPAAVQMVGLFSCPESPIHLLVYTGDEIATEVSLKKLRKTDDVTEEMAALIEYDNQIKQLRPPTLKRICLNPALKKSLFICVALLAGRQFSGIILIIYFSRQIFPQFGINNNIESVGMMLGLSTFKVAITVVTLFLIDIVGRRKLVLFGFGGLTFDTAVLTIALVLKHEDVCEESCNYINVVCYLLFMVFYSPGIGVMSWFYTAELFYHRASSIAVSIASTTNWLANLILIEAFLPLTYAVGYYIYAVFVVLDIFFFICMYIHLPETSRLPPGEIIKFYK